MKKFSVKTIVAIGIGAALFFVLGRFVAIPSPVPNTSISVQYGLLAFLSVVYGPVAGALVGFIGQASWPVSPTLSPPPSSAACCALPTRLPRPRPAA